MKNFLFWILGGGEGDLSLFLPNADYVLAEPSINGINGQQLAFEDKLFDCIAACHVSENKEITNFYRYTKFPDEQFFQTVIMNSPFAGNVVNENLRYIDWSYLDWSKIDWVNNLPHPKILTRSEFQKIQKSNKMFARKFDENIDISVLDSIDTLILNRQ